MTRRALHDSPCPGARSASRTGRLLAILVAGSGILASCTGSSPSDDSAPPAEADQGLALEEILRDVSATEEKLVALAEALSTEDFAWRPAEGVRSSGEVFMHIASVNYAFPMFTGVAAPEEAEMSIDDFFPSIAAFQGTARTKDEIVPVLRASFQHVRAAVEDPSSDLDRTLDVFGTPTSVRGFWWAHLGHLHEHLGQLIAYARSNGVAPPWS